MKITTFIIELSPKMPASIYISDTEKQWLKKLVEEKFNIIIEDSYACIQLSNKLREQYNVNINYNTLRRLFGIVDAKGNPSYFTLNEISRALSFNNFQAFVDYINKFDSDLFNELILSGYERKMIDHNEVLEYINKIKSPNWEETYQIKNIIDYCIRFSDFELLKKITLIQFNSDNDEFLEKFSLCFQDLYFEASNGNNEINDFIKTTIPKSEILQRILLQIYVREGNLNNFWGEWLELSPVNLVPDMLIFKNILLCQKDYDNKNAASAKVKFEVCKQEIKKNKYYVHPILLGRVAAWDIILNSNSKTSATYFKKLNSSFEKACFIIFFNRLTSIYLNEFYVNDLIELIDLKSMPTTLNAFNKKLLSKFYLTLAYHFHKKDNIEKVRGILQKVDPNRLDKWETEWFYGKYNYLKNIYL